MQTLLIANGELNRGAMLDRLLRLLDSPRVICADGGALQARALGLKPQTIIGDLDSLSPQQVADFAAAGVEILRYPPEKDETDLELALHHCRSIGAKEVHILGGLGGRYDQTLANILLLAHPAFRGLRVDFVDGDQQVRLLPPGRHHVRGGRGDTVSLIPLGAAAEGITTRGLRYRLDGEPLQLGPARGISNVMLEEEVTIVLRAGLLLLVHTLGRA
ncbi:MAG: thiamine diphosphokinase [Chloroflexi bacterium]|nr:thiamine diphosphokinase [Chloroflexota bacterium]